MFKKSIEKWRKNSQLANKIIFLLIRDNENDKNLYTFKYLIKKA